MHALVMHCHLVENNPRFCMRYFSFTEHLLDTEVSNTLYEVFCALFKVLLSDSVCTFFSWIHLAVRSCFCWRCALLSKCTRTWNTVTITRNPEPLASICFWLLMPTQRVEIAVAVTTECVTFPDDNSRPLCLSLSFTVLLSLGSKEADT